MPNVTLEFKQLRYFNRNLNILLNDAQKIAKYSIYDGARVAADAMSEAIDALAWVPDVVAINAWKKGVPSLISYKQKKGLQESLGIAKMRVGVGLKVSTSIGFDGYNEVVTHRWPNGQPNILIAAQCDHASSVMIPQQFIDSAYTRCKAKVIAVMELAAEKKIQDILLEDL